MMRTWLVILLCACSRSSPRAPVTTEALAPAPSVAPAGRGSASTPNTAPQEAEREAEAPQVEFRLLDVPDFGPAVLALPSTQTPLPLIVAAHGAGDTPEAQCETWSSLVGQRAIVLCPRGVALRRGANAYFYRNHFELEREFVAALAALRGALDSRVAETPALYTGYSQGATMGALMIPRHAARFRRLVLIEGGFDVWNLARAREFRKAGGERVLLVCGTGHCKRHAQRAVEWLNQTGVEARLEHVEGGGHAYWGAVAERVLATLDWVL
jgi:predicted esterase